MFLRKVFRLKFSEKYLPKSILMNPFIRVIFFKISWSCIKRGVIDTSHFVLYILNFICHPRLQFICSILKFFNICHVVNGLAQKKNSDIQAYVWRGQMENLQWKKTSSVKWIAWFYLEKHDFNRSSTYLQQTCCKLFLKLFNLGSK